MEEINQNILPSKEAETPVSPSPNQSMPALKPEIMKEPGQNNLSVKKWGLIGIIIAILNPFFAGLILGLVYLTEPKLKKIGVVVIITSIIFGTVSYFLLDKYWTIVFQGF